VIHPSLPPDADAIHASPWSTRPRAIPARPDSETSNGQRLIDRPASPTTAAGRTQRGFVTVLCSCADEDWGRGSGGRRWSGHDSSPRRIGQDMARSPLSTTREDSPRSSIQVILR